MVCAMEPKWVVRICSAFGSFVQCSSCKSGMMRMQGSSFHFSNWETTFLWLTARLNDWRLSAENLRQLCKFASFCENCNWINSVIAESQNPGGTDYITVMYSNDSELCTCSVYSNDSKLHTVLLKRYKRETTSTQFHYGWLLFRMWPHNAFDIYHHHKLQCACMTCALTGFK